MNLDAFQHVNHIRAARWHGGNPAQWSLLEWAGALCGESGEAANVAKKIRRLELAIQSKDDGHDDELGVLRERLAKEVADAMIYGLIILSLLDVSASDVIADVFNAKSKEYGFPERAPHGFHG